MGRNAAPQPRTTYAPQQYGMASSAIVSQSQAPTPLPRQQFLSPETLSGNGFGYNPNPIPTYTGGGGGGGGCFTAPVGVKTPEGFKPIGEFPKDKPFTIENETGKHEAELLVHENYKGWMIELEKGKLVTLDHLMKDGDEWVGAAKKYHGLPRLQFEGTVYNLHVITENDADRHFILENGDVAHNMKEAPENELDPYVGLWRL